MIAIVNGWDTLISALIGFAVLLLTTLGPKLIAFAAAWLDRHDKGKTTPQPDPTPPAAT